MLSIEQLRFSFPGRPMLDGLSFQLRAQAVTCLLGGNGSGKTTLFNLITGFLRPDSGSIRLRDRELVGHAPFRISRFGVARTFQDLRLIGKLTVRENVLLALPRHPGEQLACALFPSKSQLNRDDVDIRKAKTLEADYFLDEVAQRRASDISYGQQKLLTLACCAAMEASLLLLDEPAAGISPENREHIAERLVSLKNAGKTIFVIEHQPDFLERTGNAFLYLQAGHLHPFDTFDALSTSSIAHEALN